MSPAALAVLAALISGEIPEDKAEHFAAGLAIGLISTHFANRLDAPRWVRRSLSIAPVIVAGVGKELLDARDRQHHTPDPLDAAATILGGAVGVGLTLRW